MVKHPWDYSGSTIGVHGSRRFCGEVISFLDRRISFPNGLHKFACPIIILHPQSKISPLELSLSGSDASQ